jgi:hypothetical protein
MEAVSRVVGKLTVLLVFGVCSSVSLYSYVNVHIISQIAVNIGMLLNVGITAVCWTDVYSRAAGVNIDVQIDTLMDSNYYSHNTKFDALQKQKQKQEHNNSNNKLKQ